MSFWTDDAIENIPMWNMYTNISEGVRIKLPKNLFKENLIDEREYRKIFGEDSYKISGQGYYSVIPSNELLSKNYFIPTHVQQHLLTQVVYSDNKEELYPQISSVKDGNTELSMGVLGTFKNTYWRFQREWRYKLIIFPFGYNDMLEDATTNSNQKNLVKLYNGVELPFDNYFLKIDPIKFERMQIMLSPKINDGNRDIVKLLVEKYNPKASVYESDLLNRLR